MTRQQYVITDETMYIVARRNGYLIESTVGELYGDSIECLDIPNKIVEQNCKYHSQSYASRKDLTRNLSNVKSKQPVIIDLFGSYIYFCTHSDRLTENSWFNLKYIKSYFQYNGVTKIKFENNEEMVIEISYSSFNNQYLNAIKLYYKFNLQREKHYRKTDTPQYSYGNNSNAQNDLEFINEVARSSYMNYIRGIDKINTTP